MNKRFLYHDFCLLLILLLVLTGCGTDFVFSTPEIPEIVPVPQGVTATDGLLPGAVLVAWSPVSGAAGYEVYRSAHPEGGAYTLIAANLVLPQYHDSNTLPNIDFYYKVAAVSAASNRSELSQYARGSSLPLLAPPVTGLAAATDSLPDSVRISWTPVADAAAYGIFCSPETNGPGVRLGTTTDSAIVFTGMAAGRSHWFRVVAYDAFGEPSQPGTAVAWSIATEALPAVPADVQAVFQAGPQVAVSWTGSAAGFNVYRAVGTNEGYVRIATDVAAAPYTDSAVTDSVLYRYRITARNASGGESGFSQPASCGTVAAAAPDAPGGLQASTVPGAGPVSLQWDAVAGAAGYRIFRAAAATAVFVDVSGPVGGTAWTDNTAAHGSCWWYRVGAVDADGDSGPLSAPVLSDPRLPAPAAMLASGGLIEQQVFVSWTAVSDAAAYRVFRASQEDGVYLDVSGAVTAGTLQFFDPAPLPGRGWYLVAAFDSAGLQGHSSLPQSGWPKPLPLPTVPDGVTATQGEFTNGIAVSWNPVAGADHYRVARSVSSNGTFAYISPPLTNVAYFDATAGSRQYFYRIAALNAEGAGSLLSAAAAGHRGLSDRNFFILYDTTIASSLLKLTLMYNSGFMALGQEVKYGTVSGQVYYYARVHTPGAKITIEYSNYCDDYIVLNGTKTILANISEDGTTSGTMQVSSAAYNGTIEYHITVTDGKPAGGYWLVSQDGAPQTQVDWFESPSWQVVSDP